MHNCDPIQQVLPFSFSDQELEQLLSFFPQRRYGDSEIAAQLNDAARTFLWLRGQYQQRPSRAKQKAELLKLRKSAQKLIDQLRVLSMESEWVLLSDPLLQITGLYESTTLLVSLLEDLVLAIPRDSGTKSGPLSEIPVHRVIHQKLAVIWEAVTGEAFTHNPKLKTEYQGQPHSAAGLFVKTFFEIVDAKVPGTRISTAMAWAVRTKGGPLVRRSSTKKEAPQKRPKHLMVLART